MSRKRSIRNTKAFKKSVRSLQRQDRPQLEITENPIEGDLFRQVFLQEGAEPITEELISELISKGWDKERLNYWKSIGAVYSRQRNSILEPMEII